MRAGEIIEGDPADATVDTSTVNNSSYYGLYDIIVGIPPTGGYDNMIEAFPLPYLAPGQQVSAATISFYVDNDYVQGGVKFNLQLYGLKRVSLSSQAPLANAAAILSDYYLGANDTANTLLDPTMIPAGSATGQTYSYSGSNLADFINAQYANSAFAGQSLSNKRFIFFRLNPDQTTGDGVNYYQIASSRNPNRAFHPLLSLTLSGGITATAGRMQFSFNLPQNSTTSAGVYNTTTGALIRTLWGNVQYNQGTNYGVWDGNDDSGNPVATGTNYQIKLIYHNVQYVWQGMVGNTSAAQSGPNVYHSFDKIHDMAFSSTNGYYSLAYNELECPFHKFTIGSPQVPSVLGANNPDAYSNFYYIAADATHSYWAKIQGGANGIDTWIIAFNNSDGSFYTFPQGTGTNGTGLQYTHYPSCIDYDTTANQANPATGLAVQKGATGYLFVSHGSLNIVRVFDKLQGNLVGTIPVTNPGRLATTANGDVWVISNGATSSSVLRYTFANGTATLDQTLTGFSKAVGVGVSADNSLLLVSDGGSSMQIKAFTNTTGVVSGSASPVWTYGTLGGMPVNGPDVTTSCFDFNPQFANANIFYNNEAFIAFQPDNTFWIEDGGNGRVLHYSINGNTLVYIEQIAFTDASYCVTVDPTDATRVFNEFLEYSVNYSVPLGGTNGSWKMVKNWREGLPNDATHCYFGSKNGWINVVTLSNGRTYGLLNNFNNGNTVDLFELPASGPARYTGYQFNNNPLIYADGSLRFNYENGANTTMACYSAPLTGFDSSNNPIWGSPALIASTALTTKDPIPWNAFPSRTEITASGNVVDFGANQVNTGYHLGGLTQGSSSTFQWLASLSSTGTYWFPQDGHFDIGNGVQYAGNYAAALGRNIVFGYHGEFWAGGEASQWLNFLDNGLMVGRFGTYENSGCGGVSIDGFAGNSFAWSLVHGPDGNVYLYHNDESDHGGACRWRINGWDGITEMDGTGSIGSAITLASNTAGPAVNITSPLNGTVDSNGTSLTLSAEAESSGAAISSVQFMDGTTSLGTVTAAPYNLNYSGLGAGSHSITAVATDANGLSTTSAPVNITVSGDGTSAPPPVPVSLSAGTVTSQSVTLNWSEPTIATTSSTIGQIISFQCDSASDPNALKPTQVAGVAPYAVANFNLFGQGGTPPTVFNAVNNLGATIPNLGLYCDQVSSGTNSQKSLPGTAVQLFAAEVSTPSAPAISFSNIPFANYDLVVYSLPGSISSGTQTASVTVTEGPTSSTVYQTFTAVPTAYSLASVPFGTNSSVTNANAIVFHGLSTPFFELQGGNIAAFQIVERPLDQGTPTSYTIQSAQGTTGNFVNIGTASGTATSFTDTSSLSPSTTYQYRIAAVNSFGTSSYSNIVTVTTPASSTTGTTSFSAWQTQYFTADQLADPTISGPTADPYGSGVPNLLAYALQLNPATARPTDVPSPVITNGHLTVTYFEPSSITDITYIVEVSSDLINWNSGAGYTTVLSSVTGASGTTVTVQDALPATTQKHFMRLRVTQNQ